jgi:dTDP-4-amino-4,6-dideoxygalactose transaminase
MRLFINKAWGYGDPSPDHYFLALNYRLSELQGAIALGQLDILAANVETRTAMAARLTDRITGLSGIEAPLVRPGDLHAYWRYAARVDGETVPGGATALAVALSERSIASAPRYIGRPAFQCELFEKQQTFGRSRYPFTLARPEAIDYSIDAFPGVVRGLAEVLVLPWNERYSEEHVDRLATAIEESLAELSTGGR